MLACCDSSIGTMGAAKQSVNAATVDGPDEDADADAAESGATAITDASATDADATAPAVQDYDSRQCGDNAVFLMWFYAGLTIGATVGWVVCSLLLRSSMELDSMHFRNRSYQLEVGLQSIAKNTCCSGCQEAARVASSVLSRVNREWSE